MGPEHIYHLQEAAQVLHDLARQVHPVAAEPDFHASPLPSLFVSLFVRVYSCVCLFVCACVCAPTAVLSNIQARRVLVQAGASKTKTSCLRSGGIPDALKRHSNATYFGMVSYWPQWVAEESGISNVLL